MNANYEFNCSMNAQTETQYSPYTDKQYNSYINDINSGVYQNDGLSLVQFDLSIIYNSSQFTDCNDLFAVLPVMMVAFYSTNVAGTFSTPVAGFVNLLSLKNNFINLIDQADLTINGKTSEDLQTLSIFKYYLRCLFETLKQLDIGMACQNQIIGNLIYRYI
jgi:hypothetical protein